MDLSFFRSTVVGGPVPGNRVIAPRAAADDVRGRRGLLLVAGVVAGITLAAALLAFPVDFLLGTNAYWLAPMWDQAQHLTGAAFYVRSAWTWPPFFVPELDFPDGTSVIFTDSIPLLALPAKALYSLTGLFHPYFAPYLLLCYLLQGPAFVLLLHALGVRDRVCLVLGGLLAVLSPVLLARYMHVALCSHFLLLLALAVHFRATRGADGDGPRPYLLAHALLALAGLLIHPYLGLMLLIIFGMTVLQRLWQDGLTVRGAWAQVGAVAAALVATMLMAGHLGSVDLPPRPYGEGGLNLASIVPQRSGLVPGLSDYLVGHFEAMTWVGAGGLLLVACAVWLVRRREGARGVLAGRLPEVLVGFATTLFALTYAVHLGPYLVMGVPPGKVRGAVVAAMGGGGGLRDALAAFDGADLARLGLLAAVAAGGLGAAVWFALRERRYRFVAFLAGGAVVASVALVLFPRRTLTLLTNFQASSRFFWVVLYLALAAAAAVVAGRLPRHAARLVLAAALALQLVDVRPLVDDLRREALAPPRPVVPDEDALAPAFARAAAIVLVPDYLCAMMMVGKEEGQRLQALYDGLHVLASRTATPINSMRHARMSALFPTGAQAAGCAETRDRARRRAFGAGAVYFFVEPERLASAAEPAAAPRPEGCRALGRGVLCE